MHIATSSLSFMGFDFLAEITFSISSFGAPASWDDPGWGPEFDVQSIVLFNDDPDYRDCQPHTTTGALFHLLANLRSTDDAILSTIADL